MILPFYDGWGMEDYLVIKRLGQGGQGETHTVVRKADRENFVVKMVSALSPPGSLGIL